MFGCATQQTIEFDAQTLIGGRCIRRRYLVEIAVNMRIDFARPLLEFASEDIDRVRGCLITPYHVDHEVERKLEDLGIPVFAMQHAGSPEAMAEMLFRMAWLRLPEPSRTALLGVRVRVDNLAAVMWTPEKLHANVQPSGWPPDAE